MANPVPPFVHRFQPVFDQPEVGVLCLFVTRDQARPAALVQFVAEPGLPGAVGVGPSIQATASNLSRAHGGALPPLVSYLDRPFARTVDVRLRDRTSWFLNKFNRHLVVEVPSPKAIERPDSRFHWIDLEELFNAAGTSMLINAQLRSILACFAPGNPATAPARPSRRRNSAAATDESTGADSGRAIPLDAVPGWDYDEAIHSDGHSRYRIVGARCRATGREVTGWDQPFAEAAEPGVICLVRADVDGEDRYLVHREIDAGAHGRGLLFPTACHTRPNDLPDRPRRQLERFSALTIERVSLQHEEGGRFLNDSEWHVLAGCDDPAATAGSGQWLTRADLHRAVLGGAASSELRSAIAALLNPLGPPSERSTGVDLADDAVGRVRHLLGIDSRAELAGVGPA